MINGSEFVEGLVCGEPFVGVGVALEKVCNSWIGKRDKSMKRKVSDSLLGCRIEFHQDFNERLSANYFVVEVWHLAFMFAYFLFHFATPHCTLVGFQKL